MRVVVDIEANALESPTHIWCICCKDIDTGQLYTFLESEHDKFRAFAKNVVLWIGHNILGYDIPILVQFGLLQLTDIDAYCDTLILSKLVYYSRVGGHSLESYGGEFGLDKLTPPSFTEYSNELVPYCQRDVEISHLVYNHYLWIITNPEWTPSIRLEHEFQLLVNSLHNNGFYFNTQRATRLLEKVTKDLQGLDERILSAFPPRDVLVREFSPRATKHGTIAKNSVPRSLWDKICEYEVGKTYKHTRSEQFNPSSHKQLIDVLTEAGWKPTDKTKTYQRLRGETEDALKFIKYGWRINENNLSTLPSSAPEGARLLAKRILLESRRRTLTEWLSLVAQDGRIHGRFYGCGAWTHRMAHQKPNTANIPTAVELDGSPKLLGREMRELWCAPRNRLLVGVDAEGIQLRIFAHYIDDAEFIDALVRGKKSDKSDPHSLNQRVLGSVCKSRQASKRFIYALLLGAGLGKLTEILECSRGETEEALDNLLQRYTGFAKLKQELIPEDARRGYFRGLDGRLVPIPGSTVGARKHLAMSGYLQNGEAVVIKRAALLWNKKLQEQNLKYIFVNCVHDEYVIEVPNNVVQARKVSAIVADSLRETGEDLKLKCPLAGAMINDHGDYSIGLNWYDVH